MDPGERRGGLVVARVGGALALLAGTWLVLRPFLVAMVWATILAYVTWPLYRWARDRWRRPRVAAAFLTTGVLLGIALPVAWVLVNLAEQGAHLLGALQAWAREGTPLPAWLTELPWIGSRLESLRAAVPGTADLGAHLARAGGVLSQHLVSVAGGIARNVFSVAITLVTLYVLYVDGEGLIGHVRRILAAVFPHANPRLLEDVGAVLRAVVFGLLGTAIVQGVAAAIGLALFSVPSPVALGALTVVLSFVPAGPPLVWGGAAVWLFLEHGPTRAIGMALWGILFVSSVDNFLRPYLIGRSGSIRIPFLLTFFGVLGGLAAFGLLGMFLGPVLLSVTFALLADWPEPSEASSAEPRRG